MHRPITFYRLELVGAAFMIAVGSALHFAFAWFGGWVPIALVAAVNESIWEHLKLAFWPGVLWAAAMPIPARMPRHHVMAVKGFSLAVTALVIVAVFSSYTAILGRNMLALDIGTFVLAILTGQLASAWLLTHEDGPNRLVSWIGSLLLALQVMAYSTLTYFPPDHWLFVEARSGQTGLPSR